MVVLWFLLLVGPLVLVHELGHFLFAKLFGVKVLRFSIGFGSAIPGLRWRWGETEYQVAWFPLGGYVKMLGEDPTQEVAPEERHRTLGARPLWQKYLIVVGGPLFNVLLPIAIYFGYFATQSKTAPPVVGTVIPGEPAERAGFAAGDVIVSIEGRRVRYWEDVTGIVQERPGEPTRVVVRRHGQRKTLTVVPRAALQRTRLGTVERTGIIGVLRAMTTALAGPEGPDCPAARAGLRPWDWIVAVDGKRTISWHEVEAALRALPEGRRWVRLTILRPRRVPGLPFSTFDPLHLKVEVVWRRRQGRPEAYTGIVPAEMFVAAVSPGSPAEELGLRPGDRILSLDGRKLGSWILFESLLQEHPDKEMELVWQRPDGRIRRARFRLARRVELDEFKNRDVTYVFGATNNVTYRYPEPVPITNRLSRAARLSVLVTWEVTTQMVRAVGQLFRGAVPADTVGGPIMLAKVAEVAASHGLEVFLWVMALISINLALLNILPVPILDGGHVVIFTVEAFLGRPLSLKAKAAVAYVGLALILALTLFAFRNDIARYILD